MEFYMLKLLKNQKKNGKKIELTIKNDDISFSKEEMEEMKKKMEKMSENLRYRELTQEIDYSNLKDILKKYIDAYNNCSDEDEDNKIIFLNNFNETLEEFIDHFGEEFDNETLLEKYYLYVKELFLSYLETLKYGLDKSEQKSIFKRIEKYIKIFIDKSTGYLDSLIEILSKLKNNRKNKIFFYNLIIFVMKNLNDKGKECIQSNKEFSKYHSLMYFEQSHSYFEKYLKDIDTALLDKKNSDLFETEKKVCKEYINDINSGAITLTNEILLKRRVIDGKEYESLNTGFTKGMNKLNINLAQKEEELVLMLKEFENILSSIHITNEASEKEAVCIANILKINDLLSKIRIQNKYLFYLSDRCDFIIDKFKIDRNKSWCQDFLQVKKKIDAIKTTEDNYNTLFQKVREENPEIFDEIDREFIKHKGTIKFIEFIITKYPYKSLDQDKKEKDFTVYNTDLAYFLLRRYTPDNFLPGDKNSELNHCIKHEISSKLSNLITHF